VVEATVESESVEVEQSYGQELAALHAAYVAEEGAQQMSTVQTRGGTVKEQAPALLRTQVERSGCGYVGAF